VTLHELDELAAAELVTSVWERSFYLSAAGGTADATFLAPLGAARDLVADLIGAPVIELQLGDLLSSDIDEAAWECLPPNEFSEDAPTRPLAVRVNTDLSWSMTS
jgi:hypothetical protein